MDCQVAVVKPVGVKLFEVNSSAFHVRCESIVGTNLPIWSFNLGKLQQKTLVLCFIILALYL